MAERKIIVLREDGEVESIVSNEPVAWRRNLVNCVAYDAINVDGGGQVHPQCLHPDICEGGRFGCELVKTRDNGTAVRISEAKCPYQVKQGSRGALALEKRIDEMLAPKF